MRHNAIRNVEAKFLQDVCTDVKIEPALIPVNSELTEGNAATNARLDISARGVWSKYEPTYFDVRIAHPTAASHMRKSMSQLYRENEEEKKRFYNDRILNSERASFTPLVFSTTGGMAPECDRFNKRIAELIADKRGESYANVMKHIRTRLRFALLRCTLIAIRGTRGRSAPSDEAEMDEISFNLVPTSSAE